MEKYYMIYLTDANRYVARKGSQLYESGERSARLIKQTDIKDKELQDFLSDREYKLIEVDNLKKYRIRYFW